MLKNNIDDRRQGSRAARILSIRHRLYKREQKLSNQKDPWYLSATENMSYNGILFSSTAPYRVGDIVEIEVVMSAVLDIFKGYGKVVRVDKKPSGVVYQIAVQLTDLKNKQQKNVKGLRRDLPLKKTRKS